MRLPVGIPDSATSGAIHRPAPDFFIIGVYAQPTFLFSTWKARGINTMVEVPQGHDQAAWTSAAESADLWIIRPPLGTDSVHPTDTFLTTDPVAFAADNSPKLIAYALMDEPSNTFGSVDYGQVAFDPAEVDAIASGWRGKGKPIWINHIGNHINNAFITGIMTDYLDSPYIDWDSSDSYQIAAGGGPIANDQDDCYSTDQGHAIDRMSTWSGGKPMLQFIGSGNLGYETEPAQLRAQCWSSVIHGATGVIYFSIEFSPGFAFDGTAAALIPEMETFHTTIGGIEEILMSPDGGRRPYTVFCSAQNGDTPDAGQLPYPFEGCEIDNGGGGTYKILLNLLDEPATLTYAPWGITALSYGAHEVAKGYTAGDLAPRDRRRDLPTFASPQIDSGHSLANGLLFYGLDIGNGTVKDLVTGNISSNVNSSIGVTSSEFGTSLLYNGIDGRYFASSSAVRTASANAPYSWACGYVQTGSVGGYSRPFGRTANNGGTAPFVNWGFEVNPAGAGQNTACADVNDSGAAASSNNWTGNALDTYTSLVGRATAANSYKLYAQGALVTTKSVTAIQSVNSNDAIMFSGSSAVTPATEWVGLVFYGAFWNRALTEDEIALLHVDPYCFIIA